MPSTADHKIRRSPPTSCHARWDDSRPQHRFTVSEVSYTFSRSCGCGCISNDVQREPVCADVQAYWVRTTPGDGVLLTLWKVRVAQFDRYCLLATDGGLG